MTDSASRSSPYARLRTLPYLDIAAYVAVVALLLWLLIRGSEKLGYHWQWYRLWPYLPRVADGRWIAGPLVEGLLVTFKITGISLVLAFSAGLLSAIMRLSGSFVARVLARGYLETIRNTPLLVQLFFTYFVLAPVLGIDGFTSAVVTLSLFEGAFASEIFRAGIVSIHKGQWEAACSIGLNRTQTYRLVILPQAVRRIIPPLTGQAVSLIKDSALVSTIAIYDLTMRAQIIIAETYMVFELWFTVAALYLLVTLTLSQTVHYLERRLRGT